MLYSLIFSLSKINILNGNNAYIVASLFLGLCGGLIGAITYQKSESLIGDALGHSVLPGVMLAFLSVSNKTNAPMMIGIVIVGLIAYILIKVLTKTTRFDKETIMAIVLSSFFALGLLIYSLLKAYKKNNLENRGLDEFIFGDIVFIKQKDIIFLISITLISILLVTLIYKELKLNLFDKSYSEINNISNRIVTGATLVATMLFITAGLKMVGVILISSVIIAPPSAAAQWTKKFSTFLVSSSLIGGIFSMLSILFVLKVVPDANPGSSIVITLSAISISSMLFSPNGYIVKIIRRIKAVKNIKNKIGVK